jgi:DNA-binding NarL/FixJ family response regulator
MTLLPKYRNTALEMAINDFEKFCEYAGVDSKQLSVCIERERGLTLQQIALKLQLPKSTVRDVCDRCFKK